METTEEKILISAQKIFLEYGYHGTTIKKIAIEARVNHSLIHYYYRSKDNLYSKIVNYLCLNLSKVEDNILIEYCEFFTIELINNQEMVKAEINKHCNKNVFNLFMKKYFSRVYDKIVE